MAVDSVVLPSADVAARAELGESDLSCLGKPGLLGAIRQAGAWKRTEA